MFESGTFLERRLKAIEDKENKELLDKLQSVVDSDSTDDEKVQAQALIDALTEEGI